jgi:hypothetical protein
MAPSDDEPEGTGALSEAAVAAGAARWSDSDLMAQLRKTFGFEGTANELVRIDVSALHVFLQQVSIGRRRHEPPAVAPRRARRSDPRAPPRSRALFARLARLGAARARPAPPPRVFAMRFCSRRLASGARLRRPAVSR